MKIENFEIHSPEELEKLNGYIHDEYFELPEVVFNEESREVIIPFRRIFHEGKECKIRSGFFTNTYEKDVLRAEIKLYNVCEFEVKDNSKIETYSFNELSYDPSKKRIDFICCEDCRLSLSVTELNVEYRELEFKGRARITRGPLFIESSGPRVYD